MRTRPENQKKRIVWSIDVVDTDTKANAKPQPKTVVPKPKTNAANPPPGYVYVTTYFEPPVSSTTVPSVVFRQPLPQLPPLGDDPAVLDSFQINDSLFSGVKLAAAGIMGLP